MNTNVHEYETIFVMRPELPTDERSRLSEKLSGVISKGEGSVLVSEEWGKKRLAYPIKKHNHGEYTYLNYVGPAELPLELERNIRLEDNLIRFLTVVLERNVDPEERQVIAEERQRKRAEKAESDRAEEEERQAARAARNERREAAAARDAGPPPAEAAAEAAAEEPAAEAAAEEAAAEEPAAEEPAAEEPAAEAAAEEPATAPETTTTEE